MQEKEETGHFPEIPQGLVSILCKVHFNLALLTNGFTLFHFDPWYTFLSLAEEKRVFEALSP